MKNKTLHLSCLLGTIILLSSCNRSKTVKPEHKSITEAVYASGFLVPRNEYRLYAMSEGYIVAKNKSAGDAVTKGEILYQIQNDASSSKYGAAAAAFETAKQNAGDNSPVLADLRNRIKNAEAKYRNDSLNYVRLKNMFAANAVAKNQLDQAGLALEVSGNDLKSAKESYRQTQDRLQLEWRNAQSSLAGSGLDLSNYQIRSVMNGTVYEMNKELGEAVRRNDWVATVGEAGAKMLELSVDQQDIQKIKTGQDVVVKMDVTGDEVYRAKITKIYPAMNTSDQSFKVEAEFTEAYYFAFVHSSVEANIIIAHKENALIIPRKAVEGENTVYIKATGKDKKVTFKKGLQNLEFVEVVEGLKESDEVVLPKEK